MSFLMLIIVIWAAAMAAWLLVSKYVKSSDVDRIKARLAGTTKAKAKKAKQAADKTSVVRPDAVVKNRVAQMLVEKWGLGPKLGTFLEQAGLDWAPARFVHTSLVCFVAGFAAGWMLLPIGKPLVAGHRPGGRRRCRSFMCTSNAARG